MSECYLQLIEASSYMTVQSEGRCGYLRFGVSEGGALDAAALTEGAYLVGNERAAGCIEFLLGGGVFAYHGSATAFVVNGGDFALSVNGEARIGGVVYALYSGDLLEIGSVRHGFAGYLHIGGGVAVSEVLASRSTSVRCGFGGFEGRLLAAGDILPIGESVGRVHWGGRIVNPAAAVASDAVEVRTLAGSGAGYYSATVMDRFYGYEFAKTAQSDRFGSVLSYAGEALAADSGLKVISDAVVLGDIQLQGDGRLAVLLADRQPTGGYPRIATVIAADLSLFVQLPIGFPFRFREVSYESARAAWLAELRRRDNLSEFVLYGESEGDSEYLLSRNLISGVISGE